MSVHMFRELYAYHRWANRRLFDVATALGEEARVTRRGQAVQLHDASGACSDTSTERTGSGWPAGRASRPRRSPGTSSRPLASIRAPWDEIEREQRRFVEGLAPTELERVISTGTRRAEPLSAALAAPPARGKPRHPSPERDRHHDDDDQRLAAGQRDQYLLAGGALGRFADEAVGNGAGAREAPTRSALDEGAEVAAPERVPQLPERLGLDLPDALARHVEALADLFQGVLALLADAEAQPQDLLLLGRQHAERPLDLRASGPG